MQSDERDEAKVGRDFVDELEILFDGRFSRFCSTATRDFKASATSQSHFIERSGNFVQAALNSAIACMMVKSASNSVAQEFP
jgi:hypothetical protein